MMFAGPDRNLPQQQRHARRRLQQRKRLADALVDLVDLVEEQEARDLQLFELAQDQLQLRNLLFVGLADDHRGIDRRQRGAHVVDEFDRTGTIDEGVAVAHERRGGDRKLDAHAVMARFLAAVADRGPRLDGALAPDRAGAGEDRFEQRGLAALEWAHQRDAPWTRELVCRSVPFPPPMQSRCGLLAGRSRLSFQTGGGIGKRRRQCGSRPANRRECGRAPQANRLSRRPASAVEPRSASAGCSGWRIVHARLQVQIRRRRSAILRPTWPLTESGCSAMVRLEPPIRTLAPRPAATVASAVAPT